MAFFFQDLAGSTFSNNSALGSSAVWVEDGDLRIVRSTFSETAAIVLFPDASRAFGRAELSSNDLKCTASAGIDEQEREFSGREVSNVLAGCSLWLDAEGAGPSPGNAGQCCEHILMPDKAAAPRIMLRNNELEKPLLPGTESLLIVLTHVRATCPCTCPYTGTGFIGCEQGCPGDGVSCSDTRNDIAGTGGLNCWCELPPLDLDTCRRFRDIYQWPSRYLLMSIWILCNDYLGANRLWPTGTFVEIHRSMVDI